MHSCLKKLTCILFYSFAWLLHFLSVDKDSDTINNVNNKTIDDANMLMYTLEDAKPETDYEIVLSAYTRVGDSPTEKKETKTAKSGG